MHARMHVRLLRTHMHAASNVASRVHECLSGSVLVAHVCALVLLCCPALQGGSLARITSASDAVQVVAMIREWGFNSRSTGLNMIWIGANRKGELLPVPFCQIPTCLGPTHMRSSTLMHAAIMPPCQPVPSVADCGNVTLS